MGSSLLRLSAGFEKEKGSCHSGVVVVVVSNHTANFAAGTGQPVWVIA